MKDKTHLQMENYTFDSNSNTRSEAGSLNHWAYTSSAEKEHTSKTFMAEI